MAVLLHPDKRRSRKLSVTEGLLAVAILGSFILLPCTIYEMGSRSETGRNIAMARQLYLAIYNYHSDRGSYPASLDTADFQPYIDKRLADFLGEGRVTYLRPPPESPPKFVVFDLRTLGKTAPISLIRH
jgi:hypothetical protein